MFYLNFTTCALQSTTGLHWLEILNIKAESAAKAPFKTDSSTKIFKERIMKHLITCWAGPFLFVQDAWRVRLWVWQNSAGVLTDCVHFWQIHIIFYLHLSIYYMLNAIIIIIILVFKSEHKHSLHCNIINVFMTVLYLNEHFETLSWQNWLLGGGGISVGGGGGVKCPRGLSVRGVIFVIPPPWPHCWRPLLWGPVAVCFKPLHLMFCIAFDDIRLECSSSAMETIPWSSLHTVPELIWGPHEVWRSVAIDSVISCGLLLHDQVAVVSSHFSLC